MGKILIINRWPDEFADFRSYVDHSAHRVTYLANESGLAGLSMLQEGQAEVLSVDLDAHDAVVQEAKRLAAEDGPFDHVIALSEWDLLLGGRIRDVLGVSGQSEADAVGVCDKTVMKGRMQAAGVPFPVWGPADPGTARRLFDGGAQAVVIKPRRGVASRGVSVHDDLASAGSALGALEQPDDFECEEFIDGPIFHVDGIVHAGQLLYVVPSEYVGTCLGFANGQPLGSVVVDEPDLHARLVAFTADCLRALGLATGAFHLECIAGPAGLVFLEVGARIGGGEIAYNLKDVHGRDIVHDWISVQLGLPVAPGTTEAVSGFLMIPEPRPFPAVLRSVSLEHEAPTCYWSSLPNPGDVFVGDGGYDHIGGRFRFRGPASGAIRNDIAGVIEHYRLVTEHGVDA